MRLHLRSAGQCPHAGAWRLRHFVRSGVRQSLAECPHQQFLAPDILATRIRQLSGADFPGTQDPEWEFREHLISQFDALRPESEERSRSELLLRNPTATTR